MNYDSYTFKNKVVDRLNPEDKEAKKQAKAKAKRLAEAAASARIAQGLKPNETKVNKNIAKLQSKIDKVSDKKDARQKKQVAKGLKVKTRKEKLLMKQIDAPRLKVRAKSDPKLGKNPKTPKNKTITSKNKTITSNPVVVKQPKIPKQKNRTWGGLKGLSQKLFTDKKYAGNVFSKKIKNK
tara:strand:+ start:337 stop:879 length:543 start_codon:yes stop_codon:yes gene_type:complete